MREIIKILFITDLFEIMAGAERNIVQIVTGLDKRRFNAVLCSFRTGELGDYLNKLGYKVIDLDVKKVYSRKAFKKLIEIQKYIKETNIDLIVSYHENSDFFGLLLSKITGIPIISSKRDMGYNLNSRLRIAYKVVSKLFDGVIAVSDAVKNEVLKRDYISKDKIFKIYNGIDIQKMDVKKNIENKKQELGLDQEKQIVGIIAGLRKIKGIKTFIKAAKIVLQEDINAQFIIVGNDPGEKGSTRYELESLAEKLGIKNDLKFLGKREDIEDILQITDISVNCSLSEGFSNTIIESMAAGKPVVATNVGGNKEAVVEGVTGILVPPENEYILAEAILKLLQNEETANNMGRNAKRLVNKKFTLHKMINENERLYRYIIDKKKLRKKGIFKCVAVIIKNIIKYFLAVILYYSKFIDVYLKISPKKGNKAVRFLAYHNVSDDYPSYLGLCCKTDDFQKHIEILSKYFDIISAEEGIRRLNSGESCPNSIVLTFDDNYIDLYKTVYQKLKERKIPALFFVAIDPLNNNKTLFVDSIVEAFKDTKEKYIELERYGLENYIIDNEAGKHSAINKIVYKLKFASNKKRESIVNEILDQLCNSKEKNDKNNNTKSLKWKNLIDMEKNGYVFGSHTITHSNLAICNKNQIVEEILGSHEILSKHLSNKVEYFAFPFGQKEYINKYSIKVLKNSEYKNAFILSSKPKNNAGKYLIERKLINCKSYLSPFNRFSKSLFMLEISGLAYYIFFRFYKKSQIEY